MSLPFPNVPQLPGVPQLPRSPSFPPQTVSAVAAIAALGTLWEPSPPLPVWAILKSVEHIDKLPDGTSTHNTSLVPVIDPDSFLSLGHRVERSLLDFPVQEGGFATYNKVTLPPEVTLRVSKGGSQSDRAEFLGQLDAAAATLEEYTVLTPEVAYLHMNIGRYEVSRRGADGAYFLTEVDIFFRGIQTVTAQLSTTAAATSNAQNPSAQPPVNQGSVTAQTPDPNVSAAAEAKVTPTVPGE